MTVMVRRGFNDVVRVSNVLVLGLCQQDRPVSWCLLAPFGMISNQRDVTNHCDSRETPNVWFLSQQLPMSGPLRLFKPQADVGVVGDTRGELAPPKNQQGDDSTTSGGRMKEEVRLDALEISWRLDL